MFFYQINNQLLSFKYFEMSNIPMVIDLSDDEELKRLHIRKAVDPKWLNTLDNHLMILLNGPEIEDFDFLKAYENWECKKKQGEMFNLIFFAK